MQDRWAWLTVSRRCEQAVPRVPQADPAARRESRTRTALRFTGGRPDQDGDVDQRRSHPGHRGAGPQRAGQGRPGRGGGRGRHTAAPGSERPAGRAGSGAESRECFEQLLGCGSPPLVCGQCPPSRMGAPPTGQRVLKGARRVSSVTRCAPDSARSSYGETMSGHADVPPKINSRPAHTYPLE